MNLICQCCGIAATFENGREAFDAGWDAPPFFTIALCNLCPAVGVVLHLGHTQAHADWLLNGRPEEFTLERCVTDNHWPQSKRIGRVGNA